MANRSRRYLCTECGVDTRRIRTTNEPRVCVDCSISAMLEYFYAMVRSDRPAREAHQADNGEPPPRRPPLTE